MTVPEKSQDVPPNRCRIILAVPARDGIERVIGDALQAGDIASLMLLPGDMAEVEYLEHSKRIVMASADHDVAVLAVGDTRVMGRAETDGIMLGGNVNALKDAIARFSPKKIVGYGPVKTRHQAMEAAEAKPDFLFVGKFGGDTHEHPHPKNIVLGAWISAMMQISSVVMAGSALESTLEVAECGAEFAVVGRAVFENPDGVGDAIRRVNELLDEKAPVFDDET